MIHNEISIPNTVTMVLAIQQLFLEPEWALSQQPMMPKAEWAINAEAMRPISKIQLVGQKHQE